ncbi:MAG: hypothetical protein NC121_03120 [Blautia sp.]|nr:hypothetical protein [Blautia sp.]
MPGNKLKMTSVILMAYGVGDILVGLAMLAASVLAKEEIAMMLESYQGLFGFMEGSVVLILLAVMYFMMALLDMLAGIRGFRFSDGKGSIRLCQMPAVALIVIYGIDTLFKVIAGNLSNAISPLLHVVVAVLCIVFCKKVEEENKTRGIR